MYRTSSSSKARPESMLQSVKMGDGFVTNSKKRAHSSREYLCAVLTSNSYPYAHRVSISKAKSPQGRLGMGLVTTPSFMHKLHFQPHSAALAMNLRLIAWQAEESCAQEQWHHQSVLLKNFYLAIFLSHLTINNYRRGGEEQAVFSRASSTPTPPTRIRAPQLAIRTCDNAIARHACQQSTSKWNANSTHTSFPAWMTRRAATTWST